MHTFTYSLTYQREDGSLGGLIAGATGDKELPARLAHDVSYYVGLGYLVSVDWVREHCSACAGCGEHIKGKRKLRRVPCKACSGSGFARDVTIAELAH